MFSLTSSYIFFRRYFLFLFIIPVELTSMYLLLRFCFVAIKIVVIDESKRWLIIGASTFFIIIFALYMYFFSHEINMVIATFGKRSSVKGNR